MKFQPVHPGQTSPFEYMEEIKFHAGKVGQFSTWYLFRFVYIFFKFFFVSMCSLTFSSHWGEMKRSHKAVSRQYKRGIPYCWNEIFHMQLQDIIYEEFIALTGSRQNGTEFHPGQSGSYNHHLKRWNHIKRSLHDGVWLSPMAQHKKLQPWKLTEMREIGNYVSCWDCRS